ncbi:MAG TPA: hypothetical protein VHN99_00640 [Deinococcales bacterium]|nr:hypothetical protein [Deinococcales bacterium]
MSDLLIVNTPPPVEATPSSEQTERLRAACQQAESQGLSEVVLTLSWKPEGHFPRLFKSRGPRGRVIGSRRDDWYAAFPIPAVLAALDAQGARP